MKTLSINSINELLVHVVCIGTIDIWYTNWTGRSDKDLPGRQGGISTFIAARETDPSPVAILFYFGKPHAFARSPKAAIIHRMKEETRAGLRKFGAPRQFKELTSFFIAKN
jgi:hypothetical protein